MGPTPDTTLIAIYGLSVFGVVVAVAGAFPLVVRKSVNNEVFFATMDKLLKAGNRDRALELCRAVPGPCVIRVAEIALELRMTPDEVGDDQEAGARALLEGYAEDERDGITVWLIVVVAGGLTTGASLVLGYPEALVLGASAVGGLAFVFGVLAWLRIRAGLSTVAGRMAPWVQAETDPSEGAESSP